VYTLSFLTIMVAIDILKILLGEILNRKIAFSERKRRCNKIRVYDYFSFVGGVGNRGRGGLEG
jgi:hypothetical protein